MGGTSQRRGFVVAVVLGRLAFGYQFQTVASLGPDLIAAFQLDYARLGSLIGLFMASGIVAALPGGALGRRYGERLVVGIGLVAMAVGGAMSALAAGPGGIGAGRLLAGTGAVALIVMQGKMVADRFPGRDFAVVMSLLVGAFPVGAGLAGLSHATLVRLWGWPGMFAVGAGLAASSAALFLLTCGRPARTGGPAWAFPSRHECALVVIAGLMWTGYNAGYAGFLSYVPSMLAARGHPPELAGTVLLIATWANVPSIVAGGALAARLGTWPVVLVGVLAGSVSVAGSALVDWPLVWAVVFGLAGSVHAGVVVAVGTLSARPENRAVGMGMFYTVYYLGGTVLPGLFGRAADLVGSPSGALLSAAAITLLSIPIFAWHQRLQARGRS